MTIVFPNIAPTSRQLRPPVWPTTEKRSQAGVNSVRVWGSKPSEAALALGFSNILDRAAAEILSAHRQAKGHVLPVELPTGLLSGMDAELQAAFLAPITAAGLTWHFSKNEPPSVEGVKRGRSTVRVTLIAELRLQ